MNKEDIIKHLDGYCVKRGWSKCITDDDILETLEEAKMVFSKVVGSRRWWDVLQVVVDVDGKLFSYFGAVTTGDTSAKDLGWEFDPDTIAEVKPIEKTITVIEYVQV